MPHRVLRRSVPGENALGTASQALNWAPRRVGPHERVDVARERARHDSKGTELAPVAVVVEVNDRPLVAGAGRGLRNRPLLVPGVAVAVVAVVEQDVPRRQPLLPEVPVEC